MMSYLCFYSFLFILSYVSDFFILFLFLFLDLSFSFVLFRVMFLTCCFLCFLCFWTLSYFYSDPILGLILV